MSEDYYYCELCQGVYADKEMTNHIATIRTQTLPFVVRGMIKESKLCKGCLDEDESKKRTSKEKPYFVR